MFKVKGLCKLVHKDPKGNIIQVIEKENVFTNFGIRHSLKLDDIRRTYSKYNTVGGKFGSNLHISTQTRTPTIDNEVVTGLVGEAIWDYSNPLPRTEWVDATDSSPMYGEMRVRLDAQGVSRGFQTIAIIDRDIQTAYTGNDNWTTSTLRVPNGGMDTGYAHSYLLLDSPVIQGEFDIIDIFYRLYFIPNNGVGIDQGGKLVRNIGRCLFGLTFTYPWTNTEGYSTITSFDNIEEFYHAANVIHADGQAAWNRGEWFTDTVWREFNASFTASSNNTDLDVLTGKLIKSIIVGELEQEQYALTIRNFVDPNRSKLQTSWAKRSGGTPFFSANDFAVGLGRITATEAWTGDYPEFYKIVITTSGDMNTAEYNFERMLFTSFRGNSWNQLGSPIPQLNGIKPHSNGVLMPGSYGTEQRVRFIKHTRRQVIWYNTRGITLMDILDSSIFRHLGQDTETLDPLDKLDVTNITQICSDGTIIYVACRDTGLWEVDTSKNLGIPGYVTNVYNGNAYGVTLVNFGGLEDVVVATDQGLTSKLQAYSTFSNPPSPRLATYGWDSILWIEGNTAPGFTNGEIVMMSQASDTDRQILWWDRNSTTILEGMQTTTDGVTSNEWYHLSKTPSSVRCSPISGWWAISYERSVGWSGTDNTPSFGRILFGEESAVRCGKFERFINPGQFSKSLEYDWIPDFDKFDRAVIGSFSIFTTSPYRQKNFIAYFDSETNSDDQVPYIDNFSGSGGWDTNAGVEMFSSGGTEDLPNPERLIILDRDESLFCHFGYVFVPYYQEWIQYGWDGTKWVAGSSGSKPVHAAPAPLVNGIEIAFSDEGESNPFFASDFYTLPVANGVLGDGAKTISLEATVFASNYRYQVAFPTGASTLIVPDFPPFQVVVPGTSEGGFLGLDLTDSSTFKLYLDGVLIPFSNILNDGSTPPAPGIVSVNPVTGTLTFHVGDMNKAISGYYSYYISF